MGYALFWIESLATALLWTATVFAWNSRHDARWRRVIDVAAVLLPLLFYGGLAALAGVVEFQAKVSIGWFVPLLALSIGYLLGAFWLAWRSRSLVAGEPCTAASQWPLGKLAVAFAVALVLHAMTLWNLDAAVKQRMAAVRAEAGELMLSVAPQRLPDEQNAAPLYYLAFEQSGGESTGPTTKWPDVYDDAVEAMNSRRADFDFKNPALLDFLESKSAALALLRAAASRTGCFFPRDYGRPSFSMLLPEVQDMRKLAVLLAIDARRHAASGKAGLALQDIQAMFGMARHIGGDTFLVSLLVSVAIEHLACNALEVVFALTPLSPEDLDRIQIDPARSYRRLYARALLAEEAAGLATFSDLGDGAQDYGELMAMVESTDQGRFGTPPIFGLLYRVFLLDNDMRAYRRLLGEQSRAATRWYRDSKQQLDQIEGQLQRQRPGLISGLIVPALSRVGENMAEADARRRCALVAVGLQRYRARHGEFPADLAKLAPEYIAVTPLDPYDGQPLRQKRGDSGVTLYSLGPDLVDDHGAALDKVTRKGDVVFECGKAE